MKWHRSRKEKYAVYKDDTPKDRFVVYRSAWWSYRDHSKLLVSARYRHLTKLKRTDYKRWAHGLKKAGYATAPHYATALINIIQTYDLDKYDR
jgi:flagellum-specific peptidoglycan hydrolase FlgJ